LRFFDEFREPLAGTVLHPTKGMIWFSILPATRSSNRTTHKALRSFFSEHPGLERPARKRLFFPSVRRRDCANDSQRHLRPADRLEAGLTKPKSLRRSLRPARGRRISLVSRRSCPIENARVLTTRADFAQFRISLLP